MDCEFIVFQTSELWSRNLNQWIMKTKTKEHKEDHKHFVLAEDTVLPIITLVVFSLIFIACVLRLTHVWI